MFNGIEIDMLSLGDADCILVTQWTNFGAFRVLIDGGKTSHAEAVIDFLIQRGARSLYAVVCSHPHDDHAGGLIKLIQDPRLTICTAWMHDIRRHLPADALRRASSGNSSEAESVKQVVETTKELSSAFVSRHVSPKEPFAGQIISCAPTLTVLGPTMSFYESTLRAFTKVESPIAFPLLPRRAAANPFGPSLYGLLTNSLLNNNESGSYIPVQAPVGWLAPPSQFSPFNRSPLLRGVLSNSSVKEKPATQPFNNTSTVLGGLFSGMRLLFTADAGAESLDLIPAGWKNLMWMQIPHHGSDGNLSQKNIERFCPKFANIAACGDLSHPSRAIVNGLIKVGAQVFSTHKGHLWFHSGSVPYRPDYPSVYATPLKPTGGLQTPLLWPAAPTG